MNKKSGNVLVVVLAVITVLSLSFASYFFYQNQQLQKPKVEVIAPTPTPVAKDETASWKTYTNQKLGFSLKYPADLIYSGKDEYGGSFLTKDQIDYSGSEFGFSYWFINAGTISKYVNDINRDLIDGNTVKKQEVNISGNKFTKVEFEDPMAKRLYYLLEISSGLLVLNFDEKILGTFRFLDGKRVYSSIEYGYSFEYPVYWTVKEDAFNSLTNVVLINEMAAKVVSFNARPLTIGCSSGKDTAGKIVKFNIGGREIGMANFCGMEKYFIDLVTKNDTKIQLEVGFVGSNSENSAREVLQSIRGVTIPVNN